MNSICSGRSLQAGGDIEKQAGVPFPLAQVIAVEDLVKMAEKEIPPVEAVEPVGLVAEDGQTISRPAQPVHHRQQLRAEYETVENLRRELRDDMRAGRFAR